MKNEGILKVTVRLYLLSDKEDKIHRRSQLWKGNGFNVGQNTNPQNQWKLSVYVDF